MNLLTNIGISLLITAAASFGVYNYLPLSWLDALNVHPVTLGSTITTINGSDTLSSSRSVINTNFANLNADKIEATQATLSSLSSVGTITTGTWNATPVTVPYGGTGSTTLSSNQVLLGNGTGMLKTVSGFGSSGQFLTSNGPASAPTWQTGAVDQTANFNWTGTHLFKNFNASSTVANPIVLNGVSYSMPSSQGAANTFLKNDGTGALSWSGASALVYASTSPTNVVSTTATTSIVSFTIPANTLGSGNSMICDFFGGFNFRTITTGKIWLDVSYGGTASTTLLVTQSSGSTKTSTAPRIVLTAAGATNAQKLTVGPVFVEGTAAIQFVNSTSLSVDSTAAQKFYISATLGDNGGSTEFTSDQVVCSVYK